MKSKKKILVVLITLLVIAGALFVVTKMGSFGDQETKLTKKIETVGEDFYTNFYFEQISSNKTDEETAEFLGKFAEMGIKIDLDNLSRYDDEKYPNLLDEFTNKKSGEPCDIYNTKAIIFPKEPFGKEDYSLASTLDCGFEE